MPETTLPRQHEDAPAELCEYCEQPFTTTDRLALHKGLEHFQSLTESEKETFMAAQAAEENGLRMLRLKALSMLVFVYFGFLFLYAIFA